MGQDREIPGAAKDVAKTTKVEKTEVLDASTSLGSTEPGLSKEPAVETVNSDEATDRVDAAIAAWWNRVSRNSPLSRNTAALNYISESLPLLKNLLKGDSE